MLPSRLYRPENIRTARFLHIAAALFSAAVCGYCLLSLAPDLGQLARTEAALRRLRASAAQMRKQADGAGERQTIVPRITSGGVDSFARQTARWAQENRVQLDSVLPEGTPLVSDESLDGKSVGKWRATTVTLQGEGQLRPVMSFLEKFITTRMPVQLRSISVQSSGNGDTGDIQFRLVFAVYEESKTG